MLMIGSTYFITLKLQTGYCRNSHKNSILFHFNLRGKIDEQSGELFGTHFLFLQYGTTLKTKNRGFNGTRNDSAS